MCSMEPFKLPVPHLIGSLLEIRLCGYASFTQLRCTWARLRRTVISNILLRHQYSPLLRADARIPILMF